MRVQALKSGDDNECARSRQISEATQVSTMATRTGMEKIVKDAGEISTRLLDHKAFTHGQARFMLREFEERRGYREMRRLQEAEETMTRMADSLLPDTLALTQELPTMLARLEAANRMCNRILQHQDEPREHEALGKGRERRRAELDASVRRMREHCAGTDARHDREMAETRARYERLALELQEGYARTTAP
ncbi:biogenesis of lysosome-related organelles complex 1 subunit 5 isoform X1 [Petromyzon marinus]|uniref:biogenesis of lysosome-related organelles complex 1 subunit 5 isoform X1 n=2 Tax=Petromyzon marinus TaxID=7757 RepID=UPI003F6FA564